MRTGTRGFTLIELIIVIVLIGILAAIALERYASLQRDARIALLKAARATVQTSAVLAWGAVQARGGVPDPSACPGGGIATNQAGTAGTVCTPAGLVATTYAYPSSVAVPGAVPPGILGMAGFAGAFSPTLAQLNEAGYGAEVAGGVTVISVIGGAGTTGSAGARTNPTCSFSYTAPASAQAAPVIGAVVVGGC